MYIFNGQVELCRSGCSLCVNNNTCQGCLPGYVLDTYGLCLKCAPMCKTCALTDLNSCTSCVDGYYQSGGSCLKCHDTCITCSGSTISQCNSCKVGFYLSSNICAPCIENCLACRPLVDADLLCDTCRIGYVYSPTTKTCVKCISGCAYCNPDKVYDCVKCGDGFENVTTTNTVTNVTKTTCVECPKDCKHCFNGSCLACRNGLRFVNNTCMPQCRLPCRECLATNSTNCTSCVAGYTFNGTDCVPDLTCNTTKTCTGCPSGYNLIMGQCFQCNGGVNCTAC